MYQKRLRIIAGPNGSGKSSLTETLQNKNINLGYYLNPDLIHQQIEKEKKLCFNQFGLKCSNKMLMNHIDNSSFPSKIKSFFKNKQIKITDNIIFFNPKAINSYSTAITVEFLREELLNKGAKFTFETVFSHVGKIQFLEKANKKNYKIYLYFVSTDSVEKKN